MDSQLEETWQCHVQEEVEAILDFPTPTYFYQRNGNVTPV